MIEAIMPVASPMDMVGPGFINSRGGACDFRSSLSLGVAARLGDTGQLLRSQARDLATAKSEIEGNPIDPYRLLVKEVQYRNKVTDEIVTEKTLIDGIFEEPISVWTDARENGTGTKEEYQEILGRARELAAAKGKATMFWQSLGKDREDGKPEHRAYLWKKDEQGNVAAYAYQLTGSSGSLSRMLNLLSSFGRKEAEAIDAHTLLWRDTKEDVPHQRVFSAFADSLTPKEREQKHGFLRRFENEARQPDSVLWGRIESYKNQYKERLHNAYEGDIQAALEKVAPGFVALAFTRTEEAISQITVEEEIKPLVSEQTPVKEIMGSIQQKQLILMLSPLVPAYLGILHATVLHDNSRYEGEISKKKIQTVEDRDKEADKNRIEVRSVERFAQQVIIPIIPGLVEMVTIIATLPEGIFSTNSDTLMPSEQSEHFFTREYLLPQINFADSSLIEDSESRKTFPEFLTSDYSVFLQRVLLVRDEDKTIELEEEPISIVSIRNILEIIAVDSLEIVTIQKEKIDRITKFEEEMVSLGKDILMVIPQSDQLARLSLLLSIYSDGETSQKAKILIAALIYQEVKNIASYQLPDESTQLSIFIKRFNKLARESFIFEDIFEVLVAQLSQLLTIEKETISEDLLFFLYYLVRLYRTGSIYSFEKLPRTGKIGAPRWQRGQKPLKRFPSFGIIYQSVRQLTDGLSFEFLTNIWHNKTRKG